VGNLPHITVEIQDLQAGWATVIVTAGRQRVHVRCSQVVDSLGDLLRGLAGLIERAGKFEVQFTTESDGAYLLSLRRERETLEIVAKRATSDFDERRIEIGRHSRARLRWQGPFREGVAAFVAAYERLQAELGADGYRALWGHPFPEAALCGVAEAGRWRGG